MKATPAVARKIGSKQVVSRTNSLALERQEPQVEPRGLSAKEIEDRAFTSTQIMAEILQQNQRNYSFRHWGINE